MIISLMEFGSSWLMVTQNNIDNENLDMFDMLDGLDIDYANVKFSIYDWAVNGRTWT